MLEDQFSASIRNRGEQLPEELRYEEVAVLPRPCLTISKPKGYYRADRLEATVAFDYDGVTVLATSTTRGIYEASTRRFIRRDAEREKAATEQLVALDMRPQGEGWREVAGWTLAPTKLPKVACALVAGGGRSSQKARSFASRATARFL